jgi:hypothetical protein
LNGNAIKTENLILKKPLKQCEDSTNKGHRLTMILSSSVLTLNIVAYSGKPKAFGDFVAMCGAFLLRRPQGLVFSGHGAG